MREFEDVAMQFVSPLDLIKQKVVLKHLKILGRGFVGEEALGISLYCALITQKEKDAEKAICYAVNHGGDSDSTGAITGNLVGAMYGEAAIPARWRDNIEMRDLLREVCRDLLYVTMTNDRQILIKYPPPITMVNGEEYYKIRENLLGPPFRMPAGSRFFDWANKQKKLWPF